VNTLYVEDSRQFVVLRLEVGRDYPLAEERNVTERYRRPRMWVGSVDRVRHGRLKRDWTVECKIPIREIK
jgi:hypothetical protein